MGAVITAILAVVGPLLSDLLKKWLEKLLNRAAAELGPTTFGGVENQSKALFAKALDLTPRVRIVRRALLRNMLHEVPPVVAVGGKLPRAAANEMRAMAAKDAE